MKEHTYEATIYWTGNKGTGTSDYAAYGREFTLQIPNKPDLLCSADVPFRGDKTKHNPEDFFLASLSSCHMLFFLDFASRRKIVVDSYIDAATGVMEKQDGKTVITRVELCPKVTYASTVPTAEIEAELHHAAHEACFLANSVKTEISIKLD